MQTDTGIIFQAWLGHGVRVHIAFSSSNIEETTRKVRTGVTWGQRHVPAWAPRRCRHPWCAWRRSWAPSSCWSTCRPCWPAPWRWRCRSWARWWSSGAAARASPGTRSACTGLTGDSFSQHIPLTTIKKAGSPRHIYCIVHMLLGTG